MVKFNEVAENIVEKALNDFQKSFVTIGRFVVGLDGSIIVNGNCSSGKKMEILPVNFEMVTGIFRVNNSGLTSLKGCPKKVGGSFYCNNNALISLEGGPDEVSGRYSCGHNQLTSLSGSPTSVNGSFSCHNNPLTSLEGAPKVVRGAFTVSWYPNLPLLRLLNYDSFDIMTSDTKDITNLSDIMHKWHGADGSIRSKIIGCQSELIAAGYEGNAKW